MIVSGLLIQGGASDELYTQTFRVAYGFNGVVLNHGVRTWRIITLPFFQDAEYYIMLQWLVQQKEHDSNQVDFQFIFCIILVI